MEIPLEGAVGDGMEVEDVNVAEDILEVILIGSSGAGSSDTSTQ